MKPASFSLKMFWAYPMNFIAHKIFYAKMG